VSTTIVAYLSRGGPTYLEAGLSEREFFINNLLVRIHFIVVMIRCTGLVAWEYLAADSRGLVAGVDEDDRGIVPHVPDRPPNALVHCLLGFSFFSGVRNNYFAKMRIGSEEGSYLRLIDLCITQL